MGKLLLEGTSARLRFTLTGHENGAPAGEEIETSLLVGKHQCIAQRRAGEARRSDADPRGAGGDRSQQDHRIKPRFAKIESPTHTESQPADSASAANC